jgi:hypothetical protein
MAIHVDVDCNCTPRFSSAENNVEQAGLNAQCWLCPSWQVQTSKSENEEMFHDEVPST